ncbi:MAG TPA: DUF2155 domain-containing protein, partial [Arenibaculum sp.]|nr:DUF2155 domain-containing protein [Arenibaculum sp.]
MTPTIRAMALSCGLAAAFLAQPAAARAQELPARESEPMEEKQEAVLQALDKVTARVRTLELPVGSTVRFGALEVTVRTCRKAPPIEAPEAAAFLEIDENRPGEQAARIFDG